MPETQSIAYMEEPMVKVNIFTPPDYVGELMQLCQDKRGVHLDLQYLDATRCQLIYEMPLNEIIFDFFDQLKSRSRGYASLDYEIIGYKPSELVKLDVLLNGEVCDALSLIVHKDKAYIRGRAIAEKLKGVIPRQLFEIPIQAAIGNKVIARETIKAYGIDEERAVEFHNDAKGYKKNYKAISDALCEMRECGCISDDWAEEIKEDYRQRA